MSELNYFWYSKKMAQQENHLPNDSTFKEVYINEKWVRYTLWTHESTVDISHIGWDDLESLNKESLAKPKVLINGIPQ